MEYIILGLIIGFIFSWLILRGRVSSENVKLQIQLAKIQTEINEQNKGMQEKLKLVQATDQMISDKFKALSMDAMKSNNEQFLQLAQQDLEKRQKGISNVIGPLKESLEKVDGKINDLEKSRQGAYEGLKQQILSLSHSNEKLQSQTNQLSQALRAPQVRGRWGEMTLKRVVELAGMVSHCDFFEQETVPGKDSRLRPDLVVKLPAGKQIVVDAKTPLQSFLNAVEASTDQEREDCLKNHAKVLKDHLTHLSQKSYWDQFEVTPEFVVLFVPGENFFSAALLEIPNLIEIGVEKGIILATPTTLISLLKAVHYGWRQESLNDNAKEISNLGKELYERITKFAEYFEKVGRSLKQSVESYSQAVGSLESRVLIPARKLKEMGVSSKELKEIDPVDVIPRKIQSEELKSVE